MNLFSWYRIFNDVFSDENGYISIQQKDIDRQAHLQNDFMTTKETLDLMWKYLTTEAVFIQFEDTKKHNH